MAWSAIWSSVKFVPSWVGRGFGRVILLGIIMFQSAVCIQVEGGGLSRQRRGSSSVGIVLGILHGA